MKLPTSFAGNQRLHGEYLSPSVTLDCNESLHIGVGTILYSNLYRPMFEILYDDVERHDLLFPACSKAMYDFFIKTAQNIPTASIISTGRLEQAEISSSPSIFREYLY